MNDFPRFWGYNVTLGSHLYGTQNNHQFRHQYDIFSRLRIHKV